MARCKYCNESKVRQFPLQILCNGCGKVLNSDGECDNECKQDYSPMR